MELGWKAKKSGTTGVRWRRNNAQARRCSWKHRKSCRRKINGKRAVAGFVRFCYEMDALLDQPSPADGVAALFSAQTPPTARQCPPTNQIRGRNCNL